MASIITGDQITQFRALVLLKALRLECFGMRPSAGRPSAYKLVKQEYNLRGSKRSVLSQFEAMFDA